MSTMTFRNSQEAFIHKHVTQKLIEKGYEAIDVSKAANLAVDTYRNTASFGGSRGGQMFRLLPGKSRAVALPSQKASRQEQTQG